MIQEQLKVEHASRVVQGAVANDAEDFDAKRTENCSFVVSPGMDHQ